MRLIFNVFKKILIVGMIVITIILIWFSYNVIQGTINYIERDSQEHFVISILKLNQAINSSIKQNKINPANCHNCKANKAALANLFIENLNVIKSNTDTINPYFYITDGMKYIITKADGICGSNDTVDPEKANCVILVDINGDKEPNIESTGNKHKRYSFRDQYRLIINANSVEPASNSNNDVAQIAYENIRKKRYY
ncbi:MAG: hypothetical protein A2255_00225 [Candidatus Melainabacteria bacterium RIFOXYA2_FULL_32_9]|nr:MAG: hypothetical protein A2255_00225 [Candidatus Melainabacteria bacterium RIFOXYA2_FULL_32_9]